MSWVKLDDQFFMNPKVIAAGRDARDMYLAGLTYTAGQLTDGYLPEGCIMLIAAMAQVTAAAESAKRLVDVGLWDKCKGGYLIHDYLEYNPSGEQVRAIRKERAEAGRRGAQKTNDARWGEVETEEDESANGPANNDELVGKTSANVSANVSANCQQNSQQNSQQNVAPSPSPSPYPIPVPEPVPVSPKSSARASTPEREAVSAPAELRQPLQAFSFSEPDIGSAPSEQPEQPEISKPPDIREQCVQAIEYWRDIGKLRSVHSTDKDNITSLVKHYGFEQVKAAMDAERGRAIWHLQSRLMGKPIPRVESATVPA